MEGKFVGDGLYFSVEVRAGHGGPEDQDTREPARERFQAAPETDDLTQRDWDALGWLARGLISAGALGAGVVLGGGRAWLALTLVALTLFLSLASSGRMAEGTAPDHRPYWRSTRGVVGALWVMLQLASITATGLITGALLSTVHVTFSALPRAHGLVPAAIIVASLIGGAHLLLPAEGVHRSILVRVTGVVAALAGTALGACLLV